MKRIMHATDFSPQSANAFLHALRLAIDAKAKLYVVHGGEEDGAHWAQFPHVREALGRWGLIDPGKPPGALEAELGLQVAKVALRGPDLRGAISRFAHEHDCDLLVLWTHGRAGHLPFLDSSIAEDVSRAARTITLFIPGEAHGFVDGKSGRSELASVLVPIGDEFEPIYALRQIDSFLQLIAPQAKISFLHVGATAPDLRDETGAQFDLPFVLRQGDVVDEIVAAATRTGAQLIAMPTLGRQGLFDALRGSTTERVLREAKMPLLAVPVTVG